MSEWNGTCHRCGCPSPACLMSFFNTDLLCHGCSTKERTHPAFEEASRAESEAVSAGNFNFAGVGLPPDFAQWVQRSPGEA